MKKILSIALVLCMVLAFAVPSAFAADTVKIGMVTDVGGVNDHSFNQFAWAGLKALAEEDDSFEVAYLESKTDADYQTNINTFLDEDYDLIITVGYMLADATREFELLPIERDQDILRLPGFDAPFLRLRKHLYDCRS